MRRKQRDHKESAMFDYSLRSPICDSDISAWRDMPTARSHKIERELSRPVGCGDMVPDNVRCQTVDGGLVPRPFDQVLASVSESDHVFRKLELRSSIRRNQWRLPHFAHAGRFGNE